MPVHTLIYGYGLYVSFISIKKKPFADFSHFFETPQARHAAQEVLQSDGS